MNVSIDFEAAAEVFIGLMLCFVHRFEKKRCYYACYHLFDEANLDFDLSFGDVGLVAAALLTVKLQEVKVVE